MRAPGAKARPRVAPFPPTARTGRAPGGVPLSTDPVLHLLRRTTYGATPQLVADVRKAGALNWLNQQLAPGRINDAGVEQAVARAFPTLRLTSAQLRAAVSAGQLQSWIPMQHLQQATVMRAVAGKRQLQELVVEHWSNHFNVTCPSDKVWSTRHLYDLTVRQHALGRFEDLLIAVVQSPAMLYYLDNASSNAKNPNENLGRELLELHTVGVDAGYSETDVHNSALALTGWSVTSDGNDQFFLNTKARFTGSLQVMGWSSGPAPAASGVDVGTAYLRYLAHHPATARRVVTGLATRFVSDAPSARLIDGLVQTYYRYDTAIVPVLQAIFHSAEFWQSNGHKVRRPYERAVANMRALGYRPVGGVAGDWGGLAWHLGELGQAPLAWGPPNGYPDVASAWLSAQTTVSQWNSAVALAGGWWAGGHKGVAMTPMTLHGLLGTSISSKPKAGDLVDAISMRLLGQKLPAAHRNSILRWYQTKPGDVPDGWKLKPDPLKVLCALVLSGPVGGVR